MRQLSVISQQCTAGRRQRAEGNLSVISQQLSGVVLLSLLWLCGCDSFRYAATEAQKENAWLHARVCATAKDLAEDENASEQLCGLTALAQRQSEAFVMDYGLPKDPLPPSGYWPLAGGELLKRGLETRVPLDEEELEDILSQAKADAMRKPDVWTAADGVMEFAVALAGLVGGVYGVRFAGFLRQAREKSTALKEIIAGNELFKQLYPEQADRFKDAQQKQSPETKQIVTQLKAGSQ
ncbi:MAG: hypothetical protein L0Y36_06935 [Planctomycetales bacterium]|nr:hypothetical protein [Planctomycetales bacterium]